MALNMCELWFNGIKIASFAKKIQKIVLQLGVSRQTLIASSGWGLRFQIPFSDTFELH